MHQKDDGKRKSAYSGTVLEKRTVVRKIKDENKRNL